MPMPRWLSRALWMIAQAAAIGGMAWLSLRGDATARQIPVGPKEVFGALLMWTILVAFATAVITRLWDRAVLAIARGRTRMRQREQPGREELSVGRSFPRAEERAQVGQRRRIG